MQTFKRLLDLLSPSELKSAALLLIMILMMAIIDMIGVASILPFMAVLTNPDVVETNKFLNILFQNSKIFGIENKQDFLFALGILVFVFLLISLLVRAITTYMQLKFVKLREYSISKRLVEGYLHQPYTWFLNRHSSEIGKNILLEVDSVVQGGIKTVLDIIAKSMIAILLIVLIVITNPKLALIIGISLGGVYALIFYLIRAYLKKIGEKRFKNNELRFKSVLEAFSAAKEVKFGGLEKKYVQRFSTPAYIFAMSQAAFHVISQFPRFILEAIAFGGVLLVILFMMGQDGNFQNILPILSLYIFAGYRLLPAVQQIYVSFSALGFVRPSLEKLHTDIKSIKPYKDDNDQSFLSFNKSIILKNIEYEYPNASRTSLKDINITIPINSTVGLVGATGSGKTTTVDIILGLLEAKKGTLEIDGQVITQKNTRAWQSLIGYVPQNIYLTDDTVSSNIAFGLDTKNINQEAVEKASKIANLHDFIQDELPNQYQTKIGERGVRLSGGQRQRIGIARALYHNPKVLILDEDTSALDNQTEKAVMDAVNNLNKDRTIIQISHRLSTVKNCDIIFLLDKGQLQHKGTFEDLINVSENFRMNAKN